MHLTIEESRKPVDYTTSAFTTLSNYPVPPTVPGMLGASPIR